MVDSKKKPRKGTGKVKFLAHLDGIKKMIDAGHPIIAVFEEYENKMTVKEQQFGKYVRKYIKGDMKNDSQGKKQEPASSEPRNKRTAPIRTRPPGQPAFVSSDIPRDKDSLIKRKE